MTRLQVLIVDDEPAIRETLSLRVEACGHQALTADTLIGGLQSIQRARPDLVLCDVVLPPTSGLALLDWTREHDPSLPVVMITAHGEVDVAVRAMKCGARDFMTKPVDPDALRSFLDSHAADRRARAQAAALEGQLARCGTTLIGETRAMRELRRTVQLLAASDASALITGESGTGKEVVARAIHDGGSRHAKPFVALNTAALPEGLVESEIFGHEQGAFTGAARARAGCFELAESGTLFLDEIGEMPIALQPKLLRVLEDGRVRRLGGGRDTRVNVRVLAATNRPPATAIREGRLREDLFYRLCVFEVVLPPLRERVADIPLLAQHFVAEFRRRHQLRVEGVAESALEQLRAYHWPGNVRELRNVVERAVILARAGWIEPAHLPPWLRRRNAAAAGPLLVPAGTTLAQIERAVVEQTLARVGDNKAEAARQLDVDVKTIRAKLRTGGR